jgi:branched-subunit amino acid aminotransferase/4-amino-4-deoxychorismate lyase
LDVSDAAIQHGLGLFETLAVRDGLCMDLEPHLERLLRAAEHFAIPAPGDAALRRVLTRSAAENPDTPGWVKVMLVAAGDWVVFGGTMDLTEEGGPIRAVTLPWKRGPVGPLSGYKTLNYGSNALGLRHAVEHGADEGLWFNHRGRLVEGCWSNAFVWRHRRLYTPSIREGLLPGVVRARVIEAAKTRGIPVHDGPLRVPRLVRADHVFVTSSLRGLCPVTHLDGRPLGRASGYEVVARLARAIGRRHLEESGATFP